MPPLLSSVLLINLCSPVAVFVVRHRRKFDVVAFCLIHLFSIWFRHLKGITITNGSNDHCHWSRCGRELKSLRPKWELPTGMRNTTRDVPYSILSLTTFLPSIFNHITYLCTLSQVVCTLVGQELCLVFESLENAACLEAGQIRVSSVCVRSQGGAIPASGAPVVLIVKHGLSLVCWLMGCQIRIAPLLFS